MDPAPIPSNQPDPKRQRLHGAVIQCAVSLIILGIAAAAMWLPVLYVRGHDRALEASRFEEWKTSTAPVSFFDGHFYDVEIQHVFYDLIPAHDFRQGGVYLVGSSTLQTSLDPIRQYALADDHIHNFCPVGQTLVEMNAFVRYLDAHHGALDTTADHPVGFVLGLDFTEICHAKTISPDAVWSSGINKTGLVAFTPETGLQPLPMPPLKRDLRTIEAHDEAFWDHSFHRIIPERPPVVADWERAPTAHFTQLFGDDWQAGMAVEMAALRQLIDYLQAKHIAITTIYMPEKEWARDFAPEHAFRTEVQALLTEKSIPMKDLSDRIPDRDFSDYAHVNYAGLQIISPLVEAEIRSFQTRLSASASAAAPGH